ncbi:MAG: glycosyltransferase family A protein [Hyphomicrobium sp.]
MQLAVRVSVLIPCFNAEKYIGETLESVFRQTWPDIEVIVVDDGSTDKSIEEAERFGNRGIRIIRQAKRGAAAARNLAYAASSGIFVQFLDADDILAADKIALQIARLDQNTDCIASAAWGRFHDDIRTCKFESENVWQDLDPVDWLTDSRKDGLGMLFPAIWLLPKVVADRAGPWDESLSLADDTEYFTRAVLASRRVLFCEGAKCHYRSSLAGSLSGRKTRSAWDSQFRVTDLCEAYVRAVEDSERVRRGFALSWQRLAHACYPYDPEIAERALERARALHSVAIYPDGGAAFKAASRLFGWRLARRLQVASGRS